MSIFSRSWGLAAAIAASMAGALKGATLYPTSYHPSAMPADLIGTAKRNGGSSARDKRAARKARNVKRHKRACK